MSVPVVLVHGLWIHADAWQPWVAHLQSQPLHWFGENMYVLAVLGTMLLAAWWLRDDLDAGFPTWAVPRPRTSSSVHVDLPSRT